jgi:hypothetical protein
MRVTDLNLSVDLSIDLSIDVPAVVLFASA